MKTKNKLTLKLALTLAIILFLASFLSTTALANTPEELKKVDGQVTEEEANKPMAAEIKLPEGVSKPMAGETFSVVNINIETVDSGGDGYTFSGDLLTITNPDKSYLITGAGAPVKKQIVVAVGVGNTVNITIKDVNIEFEYGLPDKYKAAFLINSGKVLLNLEGTNTLTSGSDRGGVVVGVGKEITISGTTGSLTARSFYGAGIGGGSGDGGTINITGGTVTATTSGSGAGIGGGGGGGGTINITGGTVTARTSGTGAGIGGGGGGGGTINISGGDVTARTSDTGAGIGGGDSGVGGTINITGGDVTATSEYGAGIGGGDSGVGGTINITGGDVTAISEWGAGIGGGNSGVGGTINISGGTISATSEWGAGIGGGASGIGGTITISGGFVTATSSNGGAGIGGGFSGNGGVVAISGDALVTAKSNSVKDVGGGYGSSSGGSLLVEGDAVLTLATGNDNPYGKAPTTTIEGNGIIIDGQDNSLLYGGITLGLDISVDKSTVKVGEKATITVGVSGIHSTLKEPQGRVEILQDDVPVATLTDIKETNKTLTYEFTPTTIGEVIFTAQYTKSTGDFYKDAKSAALKVTVTINPPITYKVVEIPSAKNNYTAKVDVDFLDFIGVTVDKKALVSANYTAWSGSTFVRLNQAYLNTLSAGNHTITISFKGGTATATFIKSGSGTGTGGTGTGSGTGSDITIYEPKPWISGELAAAIKKADSNPATGLKDVVSVEAMFVIFSIVSALVVVRKKKIN